MREGDRQDLLKGQEGTERDLGGEGERWLSWACLVFHRAPAVDILLIRPHFSILKLRNLLCSQKGQADKGKEEWGGKTERQGRGEDEGRDN